MILCSGAFDGLHAGHIAYLDSASALRQAGERLIVAVAPDTYIRAAKGRNAFWPQKDRVRVVQSLILVDQVVRQDTFSVASIIRSAKPRLFIKGQDWAGHLPDDVLVACQEAGTEVLFVPEAPVAHTREAMAG